jgi:hypothetical protein
MVKSCYVGGYSSLLQPDGLGIEIPVTKKKCISPKNQFCISTEDMVEARDDFMIVSKGCSGIRKYLKLHKDIFLFLN